MRPQLFAKAGKSSSEKKSVLHPKTSKISNPMAKVFKESADHTDSKSGKAKVDLDAKAEKGAGKSGKMAKAMHADEAIAIEASSLSMSSCMSLSSSVSLSLSTSMSMSS
jgi:hypothetical protein